jgi:P27 family predicted phage terminase small subunit
LKKSKVAVPRHLRSETRRWFREISERYLLESHHSRLLLLAAECWDRSREARDILLKDGLVSTNKYGEARPHPAVLIEKDSRSQFMRAIRELGLDIADEPARPPVVQPTKRSY